MSGATAGPRVVFGPGKEVPMIWYRFVVAGEDSSELVDMVAI